MINQRDYLKLISEKTGYTQTDIKEVLAAMYEIVIEQIRNEENIRIMPGITLVSKYKNINYHDPLTMERKQTPKRFVCKARFSDAFKEKINEGNENNSTDF